MEIEKDALKILARELANAKQRARRRKPNLFAWSVDGRLGEIAHHIRKLRVEFRVLRKQERTLKQINREKPAHKSQNRNYTGTYGK